jgi:hypothetical protein
LEAEAHGSWERFLNPDATRRCLVSASLYIAAFEALKNTVVDRVRDFFWQGFDENGDRLHPEYTSDVLARNKSPVYASLDWLKDIAAIDNEDLAAFERAKALRNALAHELLTTLVSTGLPSKFEQRLAEMVALLRKIEVWWIVNVDMATDPDCEGRSFDEEKIVPGPLMFLQILFDVALGDDEKSSFYYKEWRKAD